MAVVFISPKERQKVFFMGITIMFILFLAVISLGVFSAKPKENVAGLVFNRPKVSIDMRVFDTDQFKSLEPFGQMQIQYSYKALTKTNQPQSGFISATSSDAAKAILEGEELVVLEIKEAQLGRDNPFVPYYKVIAAPTSAPTPPTAKKTSTGGTITGGNTSGGNTTIK